MEHLRILIVNGTLATRTGTETAVRDLATGLKRAGLTVMVYSTQLGALANELRASGISVVADLRHVPEPPDIIHGNHHTEIIDALLYFPAARGVFVCHDRRAPASLPPLFGRILSYVAVDDNCLERLKYYGIPEERMCVIFNSVDTEKFLPRAPLPPAPTRALVFSNYAAPGTHLDAVRQACAAAHLPLDVVGSSVGATADSPEDILPAYDIVFAKARCALEAMAVGAAVVLCDTTGLGALVTAADVEHFRRWNFGMRLLTTVPDPEAILQQIRRYDATDAARVSAFIRAHAGLSSTIDQYVSLYTRVMSEPFAQGTSVSSELTEYVRKTVDRLGRSELELAQYSRTERMDVLSDGGAAQITLRIDEAPEVVRPGDALYVTVEIDNNSGQALGTFPPFPLQLSYRWLLADGEEAIIADGARTPLIPPLPEQGRQTYTMRVVAPDSEGAFCLRVTLVQEYLRWLDVAPVRLYADSTVLVSTRSGVSPA